MEDVLAVYERPSDPRFPQVCMDETSKQLVGETRTPVPLEPGQPLRYDYEYVRNGVSNLFLFVEPLTGWRHVEVAARQGASCWRYGPGRPGLATMPARPRISEREHEPSGASRSE